MVLKGETIATGAPTKCTNCGTDIELTICRSPAGYYIGAYCKCGPYCRESGYYADKQQAEKALSTGLFYR